VTGHRALGRGPTGGEQRIPSHQHGGNATRGGEVEGRGPGGPRLELTGQSPPSLSSSSLSPPPCSPA
jgi:hypothetical protein